MQKITLKIILEIILFASILSGCEQRVKTMAIQYDGIDSYVDFGKPAFLSSLGNELTIVSTLTKENSADRFAVWSNQIFTGAGADLGYGLALYVNTLHKLAFSVGGTTSFGGWQYDTAISTDVIHQIAVTMDLSNVANNPILYLDGAFVVVTETQAPAGTFRPDYANQNVYLGRMGIPGATDYAKGTQNQVLFYNRILSASEIADAHTNGLLDYNYIPTTNGLVFRPNLDCAKGLTYASYPGTTLGAANTLYDLIACNLGIPSGGPIGR